MATSYFDTITPSTLNYTSDTVLCRADGLIAINKKEHVIVISGDT